MTTQILAEPKELVFIQSRAETNHDLVDEYAAMMRDGVQFDAAQGIRDENGQVYIFDGLHRGAAARLADLSLLIEVQPGTKQDAEWLALSANQKHGLRRSRQDKQRIVRNALLHPYGASLSDREIARHCGVDHKTVGKIRKELETTGEIPQFDRRVVQKADGTTYEINTSNIGNTPTRQEEAQPGDNISPTRYGESTESRWPDSGHQAEPNGGYEPTAQEFKCPRCGQEKIVGVNGSRRWCLNCGTEWPTAEEFLAEANVRRDLQPDAGPTRAELQSHFARILARLADEQLGEMATWLDELEHSLVEPDDSSSSSALLFEPAVPINQLEEA